MRQLRWILVYILQRLAIVTRRNRCQNLSSSPLRSRMVFDASTLKNTRCLAVQREWYNDHSRSTGELAMRWFSNRSIWFTWIWRWVHYQGYLRASVVTVSSERTRLEDRVSFNVDPFSNKQTGFASTLPTAVRGSLLEGIHLLAPQIADNRLGCPNHISREWPLPHRCGKERAISKCNINDTNAFLA